MKINAKKTNSASENAIQSSYFVLEIQTETQTDHETSYLLDPLGLAKYSDKWTE